ncbi:MAG: M6 family metalloprotease domain-containing protein [candidate division Zixibacteria bacterium]|nr:M6 family metalloprotease domain-containing protein [candidate division Zixibacteria bacterium]
MGTRISQGVYMMNTVFVCLVTLSFAGVSAFAVGPSKKAIAKFQADGTWEKVVANLAAFKAAGGCQPVLENYLTSRRHLQNVAAGAQVVETVLVPVILIDFPDFGYNALTYSIPEGGILQAKAIGTPQAFDSILFSRKGRPGGNPTGSMTDYFVENSYGKLVITGQVYGWFTAPRDYSYYVGTNSGLGSNGADLARDAVVAARNANVDFTPYDNDNNGSVDAVIIIHAGPGAEMGEYGIWSHFSGMGSAIYLPNGKYALMYTMNPEEYGNSVHPIGIFCHEYGHALGLPDLYDVDKTHTQSMGLGEWSLMAYGNYCGDSQSPSHCDPWCKMRLGFISPTEHVLTPPANLYQTPIPQVESEPFAYKIMPYAGSREYFLIENRQWYGFDTALPGEGLLVYHVDENQYGNADPNHYMIALEQADGFNSIAFGGSWGDQGDPFPGSSNNRNFHDLSVPNSRAYAAVPTQIAVWRISNSGPTMYADLDTRWSRPWVVLSGPDSIRFTDPIPDGDGDGVLEAGETISFTFGVRNLMRSAYGSRATLSCNDPDLTFMNNAVALSDSLSAGSAVPVGPVTPIKFTLPGDWPTHIVQFTLRLAMDSIRYGGDTTWNTTFTFSQALGRTRIVLVDDDNGKTYETRLGGPLTKFGLPYAVWNVKNSGAPLIADVQSYKSLFWFTGNETGGGAIDAAKIATLKAFVDGGGNICLASVKAPAQISAIDTGFMSQYLHARNGGLTPVDSMVAVCDGVAGNDIGNGIRVGMSSSAPVTWSNTILIPVNGGQPAFTFQNEWGNGDMGYGGVTFAGSPRSVFLSFALEFLAPSPFPVLLQPVDTLMRRIVNFLQPTGYFEPRVISIKIDGKIANAHVVSSSPVLSWSSRLATGMTQQMCELAVGSDSDWLNAEMWNPPPFAFGDSSVAYSGAALVDGQTYYLRLRVSDGTSWSSWQNGSFRLNTAPSPPILLSPAEGAMVPGNARATVANSLDPENDVLTYDFQIYSDSLLTTMIRAIAAVPATPSQTGWNVVPALPDNLRFWWRARAFDGYEYSGWSGARSFWVGGSNAPTAPVLIDPPDSSGLPLFDFKPTLRWTASTDPDMYDTIHYKLELSQSEGFTPAVQIEPIPTTQYTLTDSLAWGTHYWWRVRAIDRNGLFTLCPNPKNFWTWQLGDIDHSHGADIADLSTLIDHLFISFTPIAPLKVADVDGDCRVDISDLSALIDYLFISFTPLRVGCE